jgi:pimeloyl-ACP methyl ester carboxylesterase
MTSLLFVHGAGHAAWCWQEHFVGWFRNRGYHVAAPDLPHHGDLDRDGLKQATLRTYAQAVREIASVLEPPMVLIGHSMGGFVIQRYLEDATADLAVLLASTPPGGTGGMVRRMATRRPIAFIKTMMTGKATDSLARTRDYFFSSETPADVVETCHARLQEESTQVLKDMMSALHPERVTTPVVVMGARNDWLVAPPDELRQTARAFRTAPMTFPAGHDMMLDVAWAQVAEAIHDAIVRRLGSGGDGILEG